MEVILGRPRRRWPEEVKREAVRRTFEPGATVTGVAKAMEVVPSQLFAWRKTYRDELGFPEEPAMEPSMFVPVTVAEDPGAGEAMDDAADEDETTEEPAASARVVFGTAPVMTVKGSADPSVIEAVVGALRRR